MSHTKHCVRHGGETFADCALCASFTPKAEVFDRLVKAQVEHLVEYYTELATSDKHVKTPSMHTLQDEAKATVRANYQNQYRDCAQRAVEQARLMYDAEHCS